MVQKVAVSREFEARLRHAATGKLSLSTQQKMGTFFELGKDKAAKGETVHLDKGNSALKIFRVKLLFR